MLDGLRERGKDEVTRFGGSPKRLHHGLVDFNTDGTLQKTDGNDETVTVLDLEDDAAGTGERAMLDGDLLADVQERRAVDLKAGAEDQTDGVNLVIVDGRALIAEADDGGDAADALHFGAARRGEAGKDVAREERHFHGADTIDPHTTLGSEGGHDFEIPGG